MPSKQQLAKRRKNKKTPVDTRSAGKIYRELPELKPINREYIGHNHAFNNPPDDIERKMKIIETEMKPINKEYMDTLKKYIDGTGKIQDIISNNKTPPNNMIKKIITERCKRLLEYANMKMIYDRQQGINGLVSQLKF